MRLFNIILLAVGCRCWTTDDLALFDLVEEVNDNFYELFSVDQNATVQEIKKSYRKLSLKWHPDRNDAPEAASKFRQIAAIYEILKSDEMRERYNEILEFGLPDWRTPIYYYRYARKIPLWELAIILTLIVSTTQYLMLWGAYYDKRLTIKNQIEGQYKRKEKQYRKQNKSAEDAMEEEIAEILSEDRPRIIQLLPFAVFRCAFTTIISLPSLLVYLKQEIATKIKNNKPEDAAEEASAKRQAIKVEKIEYAVATDLKPVSNMKVDDSQKTVKIMMKRGNWSEDELQQLVRLSSYKYASGTIDRWQKIADEMQRYPDDVIAMMGRLKHANFDDFNKICAEANKERAWSGYEQMMFEEALAKYPKTLGHKRWNRIAEWMPGRNKEECIQRYKYIAQMIKEKKAAEGDSEYLNKPDQSQNLQEDEDDEIENDIEEAVNEETSDDEDDSDDYVPPP